MDSTRCCQPDGRDPTTHVHFGGQAADETRRVHAPRRNTPLRGRPHTVAAECFRLDIHLRSSGSEKIVLQRFSRCFQSEKAASTTLRADFDPPDRCLFQPRWNQAHGHFNSISCGCNGRRHEIWWLFVKESRNPYQARLYRMQS